MPYIFQPSSPGKVLKEPQKTQELWRYIDFAKFASLVQSKSLFFPALIHLSKMDPWEGLPSAMNFRKETLVPIPEVVYPLHTNSEENYSIPQLIYNLSSLQELHGNDVENVINLKRQQSREQQRQFFVNCWHINDTDSDAQWKIYGNSPSSVAIVTSYERLCESIEDPKDIYGSEISYFDYSKHQTPDGNVFWPVICKRNAFIHEREFRLIHWDYHLKNESSIPPGMCIKVNLEKLLKEIIVSPFTESWFLDVIKDFLKQNNLDSIPVSKSNLLESFPL